MFLRSECLRGDNQSARLNYNSFGARDSVYLERNHLPCHLNASKHAAAPTRSNRKMGPKRTVEENLFFFCGRPRMCKNKYFNLISAVWSLARRGGTEELLPETASPASLSARRFVPAHLVSCTKARMQIAFVRSAVAECSLKNR